jgi:hypothetical protein
LHIAVTQIQLPDVQLEFLGFIITGTPQHDLWLHMQCLQPFKTTPFFSHQKKILVCEITSKTDYRNVVSFQASDASLQIHNLFEVK